MRHMLKVLLITVVGLFVGNVDGTQSQPQTIFDLPDNTPGLMKDKQNKDVCGQQKACVHVIVPGSEAEQTFLLGNSADDEFEAIESASYKHGNIYFPADGTQPTTEEAVEYSCANVDNREDSPITEWYMKMFGIEPLSGNNYLEAGYTTENKTCKIINLVCCNDLSQETIKLTAMNIDNSYSQLNDGELEEKIKSRANTFRTIFRQIACSPIGRIFLYRLLIEIRRRSLNDNNGTTEDFDQMPYMEGLRNNARSITVSYGFYETMYTDPHVQEWRYFPATLTKSSKISITFDSVPIFIIQGKKMIRHDTTTEEIAALMFHEMLHWYQDLRAYQRTQNERVLISESGISSQMTFQSCVQEWYNTIEYWIDGEYFRGDELRVICGNMNENARNVLCGDDLSENAFRYFSNLPLRFGHSFRCKQSELCREILFSIFTAATNIFP